MSFLQKRAELIEQYNKVFDENGEVRLCGRHHCMTLIELCNNFKSDDINYGDTRTGMMNVENIKNLINSLI